VWLLLKHQSQQKFWDAAKTFFVGFGLASAGKATSVCGCNLEANKE
jgi:hypothetical protein